MIAWSVELSEFELEYEPREPLKVQCLSDFAAELSSEPNVELEWWVLYVDGASNVRGSGAGVILEGPRDLVLEQSLKFDFKVSNNEAEYEVMIPRLRLAKEIGVKAVRCKSDSQLVTGQVGGNFQTKEPHLTKYLCKVNSLIAEFEKFEVDHITREKNSRADLLSKLAS